MTLDAIKCQKSSLLLKNVGSCVKLEEQETWTVALSYQSSQDCKEGEMEPPSLIVPRHQINSSGLLYYPLSIFLRIQNPDFCV